MSANDKNTEQQSQPQQQEQVTDLPQQQPSAEQSEEVKGGVLYIGTAPPGYTGKVVPTMQTATGDSSNIT